MPRILVLIAALTCSALLGCDSSSDGGSVTGNVTFDGQPVANGVIRFVPPDPAVKHVEAIITAGKYTAAPPIGQNRVEISAVKITGKQKAYDTPDSPMVDMVAELLPPRYNVNSELTFEVDGTAQTKDFELSSK